jgi:hypothetical protein
MTERLVIVASCSDRKSLPVSDGLRLRTVSPRPAATRATRWWRRLGDADTRAAPAADVYQGDHWRVIRDLPDLAKRAGFEPELWVMSAGYGLIPAIAPIRAYSATFSARHPDTVITSATQGSQEWWSELALLRGPCRGEPRRFRDLIGGRARARLLIVASAEYLRAALPDLREAVRPLARNGRVLVVSTRAGRLDPELAASIVPSDARLKAVLGGAAQSLNARVARKLLADAPRHGLRADDVQLRFRRLLRQLPALPRYDERDPMTDDQVKDFIRRELAGMPKRPGWTPLLRELRKAGQKCEQSRFRRLYEEVTGVKRER